MEACGKPPQRKGSYTHREESIQVYRHPLPDTYKETGLLEDLNDGMEWVIIDYGRYLKQAK